MRVYRRTNLLCWIYLHIFIAQNSFVTASTIIWRIFFAILYLYLFFEIFVVLLRQFVKIFLGVWACLRTRPCPHMLVNFVPVLAKQLKGLKELSMLLISPSSSLCPFVCFSVCLSFSMNFNFLIFGLHSLFFVLHFEMMNSRCRFSLILV